MIRAERPFQESTPIGYFEIECIDAGEQGYVSIGVASMDVALDSLPGWCDASFGWHGDDGKVFHRAKGESINEKFTSGDVVGCLVDFVDRKREC